jgi:hypothetical protein
MRTESVNLQTIFGWWVRILRFDFTVLDEVRAEPQATVASIAVVFTASVLCGLGTWLWALQHDDFANIDTNEVLLKALLLGSIVQTAVWFLWVYVVYQILLRGYAARVDFSELVRTMGFAFTPAMFGVLVGITNLAVPFGVISMGMALLFSNLAVQTVSGTDVRESTLANVTGFGAFAIVMGVFANIAEVGTFGGIAPGIFFFSLDL